MYRSGNSFGVGAGTAPKLSAETRRDGEEWAPLFAYQQTTRIHLRGRRHGGRLAGPSSRDDNRSPMSLSVESAGLPSMSAGSVLAVLADERATLRRFGVRRLALFGSVVRGDADRESDLDFVVRFDRKTFRNYMGLSSWLEERFGRPVDLVLEDAIKPVLRERILREAQDVPGL